MEWIDILERLPKNVDLEKKYLVLDDGENIHTCYYKNISGYNAFYPVNCINSIYATHWREMPNNMPYYLININYFVGMEGEDWQEYKRSELKIRYNLDFVRINKLIQLGIIRYKKWRNK